MKYAELFCQSNFSFLTGASHPEELIRQASQLDYQALALTDECSVAGVVRAHRAIKDNHLKLQLIIGSLFRLFPPSQPPLKIILLCPDRRAYTELCQLITTSRRRSPKGKYLLHPDDLQPLEHCLLIWLPTGRAEDSHWGQWLHKHHQGRLWLGCQRHLRDNDHSYHHHCQTLSSTQQIPLCSCGGVLMHHARRLPLQHLLTAIRLGIPLAKAGRQLLSNGERRLRSVATIHRLFPHSWIQTTQDIADRCHFSLDELSYQYPAEVVPEGQSPMTYLRHLVARGIKRRFPQGMSQAIRQLIDKELQLIDELGYAHFFLTIADIVSFASSRGILYQGRGSAANSVVCYCLDITSVDPRQISVLFERFISRERNEPPDIDVDFEHQRREEIIQYLYQKYGRQRTALTAAVITFRFKSALREVGKALGLNLSQLDFFIKNINRRQHHLSWQEQLTSLGLDPASHMTQHLIRGVEDIIGFPRHLSQHVGGFVISEGPLSALVPIENAAMADRTVIQWDKDDLATLGLLKVDILALGMLTAIRRAFSLIQEHHHQQLSIAEITRRQDDHQVYQAIQRADTVGVFQIESRAQMSMLPRLKPRCFYDLVIQIAIVRPGPIMGEMVHPFLKRRNGEEAISYPSPAVETVLSRTLGVPIFQEQVIKLAMVAAGFSGGEADQLRRAMAKWKKNGQLIQFKDKLINGMQQRGYQTQFAERIFEQICGFGEYGFPESHSASFAVLAYTSAWLKHYYPAAFYTALLNSQPMGFYSPSQLLQDAKRHGLHILPVCINASKIDNAMINNKNNDSKQTKNSIAIRLGLRMIKSLGQAASEKIIAGRPQDGFHQPGQLRGLGLRSADIQALASANALSAISGNRYATRWQLMDPLPELPLFAAPPTETVTAVDGIQETPGDQPPSAREELLEDYQSMGLSLRQHPIALLRQHHQLDKHTTANLLPSLTHHSLVTVIGIVTGKQSPGTAGGVTFLTLEDDTGNMNVIIWPATARAQQQPFLNAKLLKIDGIVEKEKEVVHVIAGKLTDISHQFYRLSVPSRDFH